MTSEPDFEILAEARTFAARKDPALAGVRERAAALLARQALEGSVRATLRRRAPGAERASASAQLLCLATYAPDAAAADARYLWGVLSRACHHHPYELAPTRDELADWLRSTGHVLEELRPRAKD
jgi:cytochrome c5